MDMPTRVVYVAPSMSKLPLFGPIRPLEKNARIALVAPAGVIRRKEDLDRACENVRSFGWIPVTGENVRRKAAYLAGTDEERLTDLNVAIRDDTVDAIWCIRGGYGSMRILERVDYDTLRANPRPVIGFSDITALHSAIQRRTRLVTFHGPTARARIPEFARESLLRALVDQSDPCGAAPEGRTLAGGRARGRLIGGNLAVVTALLGTPYAYDFDGAILVLEDIGEAVYRIDRMLTQLLLAGALGRCAGIVAGNFRPPKEEIAGENRAVPEVLAEAARAAGIPCLSDAPFGHIPSQWTIPLGAMAELDADARSLRVIAPEA
jgi:muramoyltetrapeptide carboxypeptidase